LRLQVTLGLLLSERYDVVYCILSRNLDVLAQDVKRSNASSKVIWAYAPALTSLYPSPDLLYPLQQLLLGNYRFAYQ
jgi:hypothetical protein